MSREGVGAPLPRKEDDRLMRGRGQYIGDLRLPERRGDGGPDRVRGVPRGDDDADLRDGGRGL